MFFLKSLIELAPGIRGKKSVRRPLPSQDDFYVPWLGLRRLEPRIAFNGAPVAEADAFMTNEDSILNGTANVLDDNGHGADSDPDGDPLTVSAVNGESADVGEEIQLASGALLTLNSDGSFTYSPSQDFHGTDSFTYVANDGTADSNTATVTITVNAVNDDPVANEDTEETDEDTALTTGNVLDNDDDVDGDTLTITAFDATSAEGGTVVDNEDGTFTYTPADNFNGTDSFTYSISDGNSGSDTATVTITVNAVNDDPVAIDDTEETDEDTALTTGNVLDNDDDVDGDTLSITAFDATSAEGGTVVDNEDGTFTYTPAANFNGTDSFSYTISDGNSGTDTATVTITVNAVNDRPILNSAVAVALNSVDEDAGPPVGMVGTPVSVLVDLDSVVGGLDNVTDADGDLPGIAITDIDSTHGTWYFSIDDGSTWDEIGNISTNSALLLSHDALIYFEPEPDFFGTVTAGITFRAWDQTEGTNGTVQPVNPISGSLSLAADTASIDVNPINDDPVAQDDEFETDEDTVLNGTVNVLSDNGDGADSDPDGDALTVAEVNGSSSNVGQEITLASGALLTLNDDGTFSYDPNGQFENLAVGATATDSFTYRVNDGTADSNEATVTITVTGVNDGPVAQDDEFETDEDTVLNGTVNVLSDNGDGADSDVDGDALTVAEVNGSSSNVGQEITLASGALLTLNDDGTFSYDPNGQFENLAVGATATDSFTYRVNDGTADSNEATVTITVTGANDGPVAQDDEFETDEDTVLNGTVNVLSDNGNGADSDPDGDSLTVTAVNGVSAAVGIPIVLTSGAILTLNDDGTFAYDPNGVFETLPVGASDTDSFSYTISDGNGETDIAAVTITIIAVNDPPIVSPVIATTHEDAGTFSLDLLVASNATDIDVADVLSISALSLDSGRNITFLQNGNSLEFDTSQFNDLAVGETEQLVFTFSVSDDSGALNNTASNTVTITVEGRNDAPVVSPAVVTTNEDAGTISLDLLITSEAGDIDATDVLSVTALSLASGRAITFVLNGNSLEFDTNQFNDLGVNESELLVFNFSVSDDSGQENSTTLGTITVTVEGRNDRPVVSSVTGSTNEDANTFSLNLLSASGATDVDATDVLSVTALSLDSGRNITFLQNGNSLEFDTSQFNDLAVGEIEQLVFTFSVSDDSGALNDTASNTVTITVEGRNDSPVVSSVTDSTNEDASTFSLNLLSASGATDVDATDVLSVTALSLASGRTISFVQNGNSLEFDTNQFNDLAVGETAVLVFNFSVSDDNSLANSTASNTATVLIQGINDAPTLAAATPTLTQITEDAVGNVLNPNAGDLVTSLLGTTVASFVNDVDTSDLEGVAVTEVTGINGVWQYSLNGGASWTDIGVVSDGAALLLRPTDLVRFLPDGLNGDTPTLTYRAWDQTSGEEGTKVDVRENGTTSAFSTTTNTALLTVESVNDAPVLSGNVTLIAIDEDTLSPGGQSIAALFSDANVFSDVDNEGVLSQFAGIVVVGKVANDPVGGSWEYSSDGGTTWFAVGDVSDTAGLVINAASIVRFRPLPNEFGIPADLVVRALDGSYLGPFSNGSGVGVENRVIIDTTMNGGTTSISESFSDFKTEVNPVNDPPLFALPPGPIVLVINELLPEFLIPISEISVGPANEARQSIIGLDANVALANVNWTTDAISNGGSMVHVFPIALLDNMDAVLTVNVTDFDPVTGESAVTTQQVVLRFQVLAFSFDGTEIDNTVPTFAPLDVSIERFIPPANPFESQISALESTSAGANVGAEEGARVIAYVVTDLNGDGVLEEDVQNEIVILDSYEKIQDLFTELKRRANNLYRVYLEREDKSLQLITEIYVRNGQLIDPSDLGYATHGANTPENTVGGELPAPNDFGGETAEGASNESVSDAELPAQDVSSAQPDDPADGKEEGVPVAGADKEGPEVIAPAAATVGLVGISGLASRRAAVTESASFKKSARLRRRLLRSLGSRHHV